MYLAVNMQPKEYGTKWCTQLLHGHPKGNCLPVTSLSLFQTLQQWLNSHLDSKTKTTHERDQGHWPSPRELTSDFKHD